MKFVKFFLIFTFLFPLIAKGDDIKLGLEAAANNDFQTAFDLWYPLANSNNADAQILMGKLYLGGHGVDEDFEIAESWFLKAAEQGVGYAQLKLANLYSDENYHNRNLLKARHWFHQAAIQGSDEAQYSLGWMYFYGIGGPEDHNEGLKWLRKAADQENSLAYYLLGEAYFYGLGVSEDAREARQWYLKAAEKGDDDGQFSLGFLLLNGIGGDKDPPSAIKWLKKAAEQDNSQALYHLGRSYLIGNGVEVDFKEAESLLKKAADYEIGEACTLIGAMYLFGIGVDQSDTKALSWYNKGHEFGEESSLNMLLVVQDKIKLRKKHPLAPTLFGVPIFGAHRSEMRVAIEKYGINSVREENIYFADLYDPSNVFKGSDQLAIFYSKKTNLGSESSTEYLSRVNYRFKSENDISTIHKLQKMISSKYGTPTEKTITDDLTSVKFQWKMDGVTIFLERGWPDTTTHLVYKVDGFSDMLHQELKELD